MPLNSVWLLMADIFEAATTKHHHDPRGSTGLQFYKSKTSPVIGVSYLPAGVAVMEKIRMFDMLDINK